MALSPTQLDAICRELLKGEGTVYAVLDAAAAPEVPMFLGDLGLPFRSLYSGDAEQELADVAPYLARLDSDGHVRALVEFAWGRSCAVVMRSEAPFADVRRHLRKFLMVDLEGEEVYFRFYDPRVLRVYLPTCARPEWQEFFGIIRTFVLEGDSGEVATFERDRFAGASEGAE